MAVFSKLGSRTTLHYASWFKRRVILHWITVPKTVENVNCPVSGVNSASGVVCFFQEYRPLCLYLDVLLLHYHLFLNQYRCPMTDWLSNNSIKCTQFSDNFLLFCYFLCMLIEFNQLFLQNQHLQVWSMLDSLKWQLYPRSFVLFIFLKTYERCLYVHVTSTLIYSWIIIWNNSRCCAGYTYM